MADVKDVLAYMLNRYRGETSNARVTKMVYLTDWRHSLLYGRQVTDIEWYFDNYGPFVWTVIEAARENPDLFEIEATQTVFGNSKNVLRLRNKQYKPQLGDSERAAVDFVVDATKDLTFDAFIKLVYSTYPIMKSDRYESLDLPALAREYKATPVFQNVQ